LTFLWAGQRAGDHHQFILQQRTGHWSALKTERRRSVNRSQKAELIETLQSTFNEASTVVVAHQVGMTVVESSDLRGKMREAGAGFKVTKNRIAKLALKGTRFEALESMFTGPTAIGTSNDPVAAAKILVEYAKSNDKVAVIGGSMDGKILDKAGVEALARLPSLDELRGRLVGLIQAPAAKVARVTQAPANKVARVIKAREEQLQQGS
jgi:large subunit ribosomal protein L10